MKYANSKIVKNARPCGCGCDSVSSHMFVNEHSQIRYFLACDRCGVQTAAFTGRKKAIKAWGMGKESEAVNEPSV